MSLSPNFSVCDSTASPPDGSSSFKSDISPQTHGILLEGLESATKEVEYRKRHDACESSFTSRQQTYDYDEASSYVENQMAENCFEIPLSSTQHLTPSNDLPDLATITDFDSELMHSDGTGNFLVPNSLVESSIQRFTDNVEIHRHSNIEEPSFATVPSILYGSDNDLSRTALSDPVNVTQLVSHFEPPAYSGLSLDRTNTCNSSAVSAYPRSDIFSNLENVADVSQYPFETWSHSGFQPAYSKPTDQRHFDNYKGPLAHYDYPEHFSPPISSPANQKCSYNQSLCSEKTTTTIWNSSPQSESSQVETSEKVNTEEKCETVSIIDLTTSPSPSGNESAMSEDSSSFQSTSCIHSYTSFVDHGWCSEPASHGATDVLASRLGEREIQMRSGEECVADGSVQCLRSSNDRFITSCNELVGSDKAHDQFSWAQTQGCPENEWSKWHFSPATTLPDGHRADHVAPNDYLESSSFHSGESSRFDAASRASDQLLSTSSETGPSRSSFTHKGNTPVIELANRDLWWKFFEIGTEMIITKAGRRMFPAIKLKVNFLNPLKNYAMAIDIMPIDNNRYRYVYHSSQWMAAGTTEASVAPCTYFHPDSPARGEVWMRQDVTFDKLKLTNHELNKKGHVVLHSMHKYQPRIHLIECDDPRPIEVERLVPRNMRIDDVVREDVTTFVFPECAFTTVTAYQNQQITKLKIDRNPFAKGFRDSSKLWRPKQNVAAGKSKRAWSSSGNSETIATCHISQTAAERSPRNPVSHHYSRCEANAQDYHKICHSTQLEVNPSSANHLHVRNLEQASNIYRQHSSVDAVDSFQYLGGISSTEIMKPEMMQSNDVRSFESTSDTGSMLSSFSSLVPFYQP